MIYLLCLNSILPFTIDPVSLVLLVHYPIVLYFFFFLIYFFLVIIIIIVEKPKRLLTDRVELIYIYIYIWDIYHLYLYYSVKKI